MRNIIIIVGLVLISIYLYTLYHFEKIERKRFMNNYDILVNDVNKAEVLHSYEIDKYYRSIDSLRNVIGSIRQKTVSTIFQTKYNYKDSILLYPILDTIRINDTIKILKTYTNKTKCFDLILIQENDTIKEFLEFKDELTGFLHWERPHRFWFIRWGAKEYFLKLYSACKNDTVKINKLILVN